MNIAFKAPADQEPARDGLAHALFRPMGAEGVYARTALHEQVVDGLSNLISRHREAGTEILRFPPVMSRQQLERAVYLKSFPHLLGCVSALPGEEEGIRSAVAQFESGGDWATALTPSDLVLSPAACYPLYPLVASRGPVPAHGLLFDVACDCFRHEPSTHLDRLQSFRMREYVCIGEPKAVDDFRARWMVEARHIAERLGLPHRIEQASDPFFGRGGKLMAMSQVEQALKFELLIRMRPADEPTACMSFNCHRDHFGAAWEMRTATDEIAHTGCVAFGIDRLALALFSIHGVEFRTWPSSAREALGL